MGSNKEVCEALRVRMLGNLPCKGEATDIRPGQQFEEILAYKRPSYDLETN